MKSEQIAGLLGTGGIKASILLDMGRVIEPELTDDALQERITEAKAIAGKDGSLLSKIKRLEEEKRLLSVSNAELSYELDNAKGSSDLEQELVKLKVLNTDLTEKLAKEKALNQTLNILNADLNSNIEKLDSQMHKELEAVKEQTLRDEFIKEQKEQTKYLLHQQQEPTPNAGMQYFIQVGKDGENKPIEVKEQSSKAMIFSLIEPINVQFVLGGEAIIADLRSLTETAEVNPDAPFTLKTAFTNAEALMVAKMARKTQ